MLDEPSKRPKPRVEAINTSFAVRVILPLFSVGGRHTQSPFALRRPVLTVSGGGYVGNLGTPGNHRRVAMRSRNSRPALAERVPPESSYAG